MKATNNLIMDLRDDINQLQGDYTKLRIFKEEIEENLDKEKEKL